MPRSHPVRKMEAAPGNLLLGGTEEAIHQEMKGSSPVAKRLPCGASMLPHSTSLQLKPRSTSPQESPRGLRSKSPQLKPRSATPKEPPRGRSPSRRSPPEAVHRPQQSQGPRSANSLAATKSSSDLGGHGKRFAVCCATRTKEDNTKLTTRTKSKVGSAASPEPQKLGPRSLVLHGFHAQFPKHQGFGDLKHAVGTFSLRMGSTLTLHL